MTEARPLAVRPFATGYLADADRHYLDEITGDWESLSHLWYRATKVLQDTLGTA